MLIAKVSPSSSSSPSTTPTTTYKIVEIDNPLDFRNCLVIYLHKLIVNMKIREEKMTEQWTNFADIFEKEIKQKIYQLDQFIQTSKSGQTFEYYKGFLAKDSETTLGKEVKKLGAYARRLCDRKVITLVQKRIAPEEFIYMAVKR